MTAPATHAPVRHSSLLDGVDQAVSIRYNNLVYELKAAGQDIVTLSLGEAFFDVPTPDFAGLAADDLHHYSHSRGLPELRQRLARYYREQLGVPVDPDREMLVTAGSKAAIYMALMAVIEPGDEVVVLEPYWLSYPAQVRLLRGVPVAVPLGVDVFDLERYLSPRTRAIILNNPNNPSGHLYSEAELDHLHALAERHGLVLLADEAYNEFIPPGSEFVALGRGDPDKRHTITVNSMSKNYGISGWRIGYLLACPSYVDQILKVNQHLITCAPTILSRYLATHFDDLIDHMRPQIRDVVAMRNSAARWCAEAEIETVPGTATFYLFASLGRSTLDSEAFSMRLLKEGGVCVVPGIAYGESCDRHIRVSVGTESPARIRSGIAAIRRLIDTTSPAP